MAKKRPTHISKADLIEMTIVSLETQLAHSRSDAAELRRQVISLSNQVSRYQLEESHQKSEQQQSAMAKLRDQERVNAYEKHRQLAASYAERYGFDTDKAAIHPVTGEIVPLPEDDATA